MPQGPSGALSTRPERPGCPRALHQAAEP
ncbi:Dipeptide transport ATP-binding protein DppF [Caballeronia sordidicola]|uniref:Dipeptide transport ATP-binding protein DppF n=1 Tax=Caballeronia sordidicola TaxID=196367 RepID=A0A242MPD6_CABSO|nr:Dipeptide transport ATP-binding protein DppF [Caballeronia sordidicola]OTP78921.1 Dipeptide transport ATP-binding protein DppF [Caballeronia sordidicola]